MGEHVARKVEHVNFEFGLLPLRNKGISLNAPEQKNNYFYQQFALQGHQPYFTITEVNVQALLAGKTLGGIGQRNLHKDMIL